MTREVFLLQVSPKRSLPSLLADPCTKGPFAVFKEAQSLPEGLFPLQDSPSGRVSLFARLFSFEGGPNASPGTNFAHPFIPAVLSTQFPFTTKLSGSSYLFRNSLPLLQAPLSVPPFRTYVGSWRTTSFLGPPSQSR